MSDIFKNDKPVYWDDEKRMFYWIEWFDTGNSEIPTRHYISINPTQPSIDPHILKDNKQITKEIK